MPRENRLQCQHCNIRFPGRADAKYCGPSCRSAASKLRRQKRTQARTGTSGRRISALQAALTNALKKAEREPADGAIVALARMYSRHLDQHPDDLDKLGPQLTAILIQLNMTPKARGHAKTVPDDTRSARDVKLDELRERRERRRPDRTAAVDPTAT